jgi:formylglycine-generating enzyme required for sulfatase activity
MKPYEYHASTSELVRILKAGHHGVELTDKEWRTLYTWIDFNAPHHGRFVYNKVWYSPYDQYERRIELANKYGNGAGVEWKRELEEYEQWLKANPQPAAVRKEVKEPNYKEVKSKRFPFTEAEAQEMAKRYGTDRRTIELADGVKMTLVRIPAGTFIMGNNNRGLDNAPESVVKIDRPFWMSETEVTNEQYNTVDPTHDSRFTAQFWKDHVGPGYAANRPSQPVTRISWNQAMEFCRVVSERVGVDITLPTEAQWECACRSGRSGSVPANEDNARYEKNNGDITDFMGDPNNGTAIVGSYNANPLGFYDFNGNVLEMCLDAYASDADLKVLYAELNPVIDPIGPAVNSTARYHATRGGYYDNSGSLASAYYRAYGVNSTITGKRDHRIGLRVAVSPEWK